jgi:hypothetical protein
MSHKDLKSLIKLLKANGIVSYEQDGLKLLLDPNHVSASSSKSLSKQPKDSVQVIQEQVGKLIPTLSDEEWLISTNLPNAEDETVQ